MRTEKVRKFNSGTILEFLPEEIRVDGNKALLKEWSYCIDGCGNPSPLGLAAAKRVGEICAERHLRAVVVLKPGCCEAFLKAFLSRKGTAIVIVPCADKYLTDDQRTILAMAEGFGGLIIRYASGNTSGARITTAQVMAFALSKKLIVVEAGDDLSGYSSEAAIVRFYDGNDAGKEMGCIDLSQTKTGNCAGNEKLLARGDVKPLANKNCFDLFFDGQIVFRKEAQA